MKIKRLIKSELYDAQKDYIEKLDAKIEDLEYEIRKDTKIIEEFEDQKIRLNHIIDIHEKTIDDLEYLIEELRITINNQIIEIDTLEKENVYIQEKREKLEKYIRNVEGVIV